MAFARVSHPALFQAPLSRGIATVLGPQGLRLTGLTSFHLDEGLLTEWVDLQAEALAHYHQWLEE